jgi:carbonic anhydrase/acetyltransferase-like protein (isoleucine patch superfamily)
MTTLRLLKYAVSVHKYPRYFVDLCYVPHMLAFTWRRQGMILGRGIVWSGAPILSITPRSTIQIGERCVICSRSRQTALGVNHPVVLRTLRPGAKLIIGQKVRMSGTTICAAARVIIGDQCVIGANVTIVDTDFHSLGPEWRSTSEDGLRALVSPVNIGNNVFIGGGSYILKGVTIGEGAVIGAGSVVTKNVPPNVIAAGNPAKVIKPVGGAKDPTYSSAV